MTCTDFLIFVKPSHYIHTGCPISFHTDGFQQCIKKFFMVTQRGCLNREQQIEIILRLCSGSSRMVANAFSRKHGTNITHDTGKAYWKVKKRKELLQIK